MDYGYRAEQKQQYSIITICMKETEGFEVVKETLFHDCVNLITEG